MSYWMSFCDPSKPEGSQFLGAAIVDGKDLTEAVFISHIRGINPGGEIMIVEFMPVADSKIGPEWRMRLMDRAECERFDEWAKANGIVPS